MIELEEIKLAMRKNKITKKKLSENSIYTYNQIRRMLNGNITLKELKNIRSILESII